MKIQDTGVKLSVIGGSCNLTQAGMHMHAHPTYMTTDTLTAFAEDVPGLKGAVCVCVCVCVCVFMCGWERER